MNVRCEACEEWYDDARRWTICPHNPLDVSVSAIVCLKHDLFDCTICEGEVDSAMGKVFDAMVPGDPQEIVEKADKALDHLGLGDGGRLTPAQLARAKEVADECRPMVEASVIVPLGGPQYEAAMKYFPTDGNLRLEFHRFLQHFNAIEGTVRDVEETSDPIWDTKREEFFSIVALMIQHGWRWKSRRF